MLSKDVRIASLIELGRRLARKGDDFDMALKLASQKNPWFTPTHSELAFSAISEQLLNEQKFTRFAMKYDLERNQALQVGVINAGNIPMAGMHDIICVLLSGHYLHLKPSSKDEVLINYVLEELTQIEPAWKNYWKVEDQLKGLDAYIATGSNNSARYFNAYFGKYPSIIRKNRNSIAVLTGDETDEQLIALGQDVFLYFGLGCRNVSKVLVPENYHFPKLLEVWQEVYEEYIMHNAYKNNFDYSYALYLLNKVPFLMNGSILVMESEQLASRIACLHYEKYKNQNHLEDIITRDKEGIQCIVGNVSIPGSKLIDFGRAQYPEIDDFADDIDTMLFLTQVK